MSSILRSSSIPLGAARAPRPCADTDVEALLELSPQALLMFDERGQVLRSNPPLRRLAGHATERVDQLPPVLQQLLGWPGDLPRPGAPRELDGFVDGQDGLRHRLRARITALAPMEQGARWLASFDDRSIEDERDLSRLEIAALMGDAEVGLASWDAARGWVPRPATSARRAVGAAAGAPSAAITSVSKELVEPDSLPEYERLQRALRQRERVEVRYAVQHPQTGQRWLMSRVEPGELSPGRAAFSVMTLDVSQEEGARRRNEQLLRELTAILDENPAGMAYFLGPGLVRCNRRFELLLGLPEGSARGATLGELLLRGGVAPEVVDATLAAFVRDDRCATEFSPGEVGGSGRWYALALRRSGDIGRGADETVAVLTDITELRQREAEMAALARERELMFSLSDVGIVYQRDGRIERANQAMEELSGHDQASLQGMPLSELFADEASYLAHSASERRDLATSGRHSAERQLRRRDGRSLWVLSSQRLVDTANPRAGSICSFVSVDDRRRAREQVLLQADRTRAILDSVLVGIVSVDDRGIEWMNRSARRMFGGELADFVGQQIGTVATAEPDHPLRRTDWLTTLEEGQAETFDCRLKARDGREFWVVGNVVVTGRESQQRQLTFALMDIDSRREAEVQIARARASLQRIIETAPLAIALFEADSHKVVQLNQMMSEFAGQPLARMQDQPPLRWLPADLAEPLVADLDRAARTHASVHRELLLPATPGQAPRVWDVRIVALDARGEVPEQLLLVAGDVTEQRAADQARLEAAIAQREMLVKEVHHRIKNNLQGVAGLLQQNAQRHPEAAAAIAEAVSQVHAIAQVHGLQVGISGPLRVRNVVEAICGSVQRMFGRPISVTIDGAAPHRFALSEADSIPIALTVNELLTNAIKHSGAGGALGCQVHFGEQEVSIAVVNDGRLPEGFQLSAVPTGISGLGLVRALLPRKGAALALEQQGGSVVAALRLQPPAVSLLAPL
ncbi:PAS domain S-box protein [Ideonella alba]|uniref:PAS domain S-box protein n=1 Tax=Ideonella alba TaxID=2824118 RepID=A0A941BGX5_9BURK|nr:PAS domain S-box protein [Ideonella alba]MBQ0933451.1 PAS domain S-box protein [Ideonella alba]